MTTTITTPCIVCATHAQLKNSPFFATRGIGWPLTQVAGHTVHRACAHDAEDAARTAADGTLTIDADGIGRWATNGHAIPGESAALLTALGLAPGLNRAATAATAAAETRAAIERYRAAQPTPEEVAGMRAAFGPGTTVADVLTGRQTQL